MTHLAPRAALFTLALTLVAAAPAAAQSSDPIEAVWEFSQGRVAVERQSDGSFTGTIIRATTLSNCPHQPGERMWTDVAAQPDGQYFGKHQYLRDSDCAPVSRGNAAFRVLTRPDGSRFLRICFAKPENPELQPKIAPDGSNTDTNDDCVDSNFVEPLTQAPPKLADVVTGLPRQTSGCASRRRFPIRLKEPPGDAIAPSPRPRVTRNGKRIPVVFRAGRWRSVIDLRGLPRGRYTFKIVATTVRGRTIQGSRRYRTCGKRRRIGTVGPV